MTEERDPSSPEELFESFVESGVEDFKAFLAQYPQSTEAERLRKRIEELRYLRAKSDGTAEAMRTYLQHHPDGANADKAKKAEDKLSFDVAKTEHTVDAYQAYLDSHADGFFVENARDAKDVILYLPSMSAGEVTTERINMAGDKKGELNGWRVMADVTNGGGRTLSVVECHVDYLDDKGAVVQSDKWWAVAHDLGGFPVRPEMKATLKKGESRQFMFSTAETPKGFTDRFAVRVTDIQFRK